MLGGLGRVALLAVLAPVTLLLSPDVPAGASSPTVLTIATTGTVDSLSPFLAQRVLPTQVHRLVYDFLTNYDASDDHPVGAMATGWATSSDKLTWTFAIRSGMTWSDGQPVTAHDIAWTYQLIMTNADAATANGNFVANFSSVTAPDDTSLVIKLARPQATMLALDIPIVPEHVWRNHVQDIGQFNNDVTLPVVGSGPFVLTGYRPEQYIELSANKHYWRGPPKFDKVIFRFYKDIDAEVSALRKGEVDFVGGLTSAQFDALDGTSHIARNRAHGKGFYALNINPGATTTSGQAFGNGNPALHDPRVRRAIRYSIDPQVLVAKTLGGYGEVGEGYLPPIFAANHWRPDTTEAITYDPVTANRLLDEAEYRRSGNGMRVTPDGRPFVLRLAGMTQRPADARNATYLTEWLKAVGILVDTSIVSEGALIDAETAGQYDLTFDSWLTNPDPDYALSIQTCGDRPATAGESFPGANFVCDPAYDALYAQQLGEYDPAKRSALIKQMQARLYADSYVNVLYYANVLEAYRSDVIASMSKQPQPDGAYGNQDGYWSWWSATPAMVRTTTSHRAALIDAGAAGVLLLVALTGLVLWLRRRTTAHRRP